MDRKKIEERPNRELHMEALAALEQARAMPKGSARSEALKRAGLLQNAADMHQTWPSAEDLIRSSACAPHACDRN
jgi:hypothetical protein